VDVSSKKTGLQWSVVRNIHCMHELIYIRVYVDDNIHEEMECPLDMDDSLFLCES
jgi:hypothetical protein